MAPEPKPSGIGHGTLYTVRVYLDGANDIQVYDNVKHVWFKANSTVLVILHYYDEKTYRYVSIMRERVVWYSMMLQVPT
jgi:hypothetical protein